MKQITILLLLTFGVRGQTWDKDGDSKHYIAGVVISNWAGSSAYYFGAKPFKACLIGFAAGTLAGLGKEYIYDKQMNRGTFSKGDLTTTIWGSLVGTFCLRIALDRNQKKFNFVEYERHNNRTGS
jgi:hypothetical protein